MNLEFLLGRTPLRDTFRELQKDNGGIVFHHRMTYGHAVTLAAAYDCSYRAGLPLVVVENQRLWKSQQEMLERAGLACDALWIRPNDLIYDWCAPWWNYEHKFNLCLNWTDTWTRSKRTKRWAVLNSMSNQCMNRFMSAEEVRLFHWQSPSKYRPREKYIQRLSIDNGLNVVHDRIPTGLWINLRRDAIQQERAENAKWNRWRR